LRRKSLVQLRIVRHFCEYQILSYQETRLKRLVNFHPQTSLSSDRRSSSIAQNVSDDAKKFIDIDTRIYEKVKKEIGAEKAFPHIYEKISKLGRS
jgi:hypothetical protein